MRRVVAWIGYLGRAAAVLALLTIGAIPYAHSKGGDAAAEPFAVAAFFMLVFAVLAVR